MSAADKKLEIKAFYPVITVAFELGNDFEKLLSLDVFLFESSKSLFL